MLYELSRKLISINRYEQTNLSWNSSVLIAHSSKELHVLEFSYNLNAICKNLDFKECTVSSSKNSSLTNDYLTRFVSQGVKNLDLVEMVINSPFWPHNNLLMQEMMSITAYQWSPFNFVNENDSLLAVLNSIGIVEFFEAKNYSWHCIMNFSLHMIQHLGETFAQLFKYPNNFTEVKETVYSLSTASICWAPQLNENNSCYFVTAQKSGLILFWLINYHDSNVQIQFYGCFQSSKDVEIVHMVWIPVSENKFILICSNEYGEIVANECEIDEKIALVQLHNVWWYKDKMVTTYLHYHFEDDKLLLLFTKHRHLVIQMYNKNLELLSQNVQNINDFKITCLTKHKKTFYVTTMNTKIYRIDYSIVEETLNVSLQLIETKDTFSGYELNSLAVSTNGAIFALSMISRKLLHRKQSLKIEIVFLSSDIGFDADVSTILNNPTKQLTHMWDVIEVMRCKSLKTKKLPDLDYSSLLKDDCDVYNLKVYLILLHYYHNLIKVMAKDLKGKMPETSVHVIKERILMLQAYNMIHKIYEKFQIESNLDHSDSEYFECCKKYLIHYCKKYRKNMTDLVSEDILNISNVDIQYVCQCCDENITEFSCKNRHVNMICSHTFTPIENDYLVCRSCNTTAQSKLREHSPNCVFCDMYLSNSY